MTVDDLQISPSQSESYLGCPRRWWFKSVVRMPTVQNQEQYVVGNVVHSIAERFLSADDNGRVPVLPDGAGGGVWETGPLAGQRAGDPVELYPKGWDAPLRSPALAGHIRKVVKEAIETGVLIRHTGRIIEKGYKRGVIPGVIISGRMDVEHPAGVDDHKTTSARKWCSTEKDLADDPKMLCYGHEWLMRWRETWGEGNDPDFVTLRLNYVGKDPDDPFTKHVEVDVDTQVVEDWWKETLLPTAQEMLDLANSDLTEKDWAKVEGPRRRGECRKYRGCDFAPVCSRVRAPAAHRRIIDRINGKVPEPKPRSSTAIATSGDKKMSLFSKARARKGGIPSTSVESAPAPTEAAEAGGAAVAEIDPESVAGVAPWANPRCKACEGSGVSSKNGPCTACDTVASRKKQETSADFKIWNDEETGELCWAEKGAADDAPAEGSATRTAKPAENVTRPKATRARKKKEPEPEPEKPADPEPAKPAKKVAKKAAKKTPRDEESAVERADVVPGLVLLVNAVFLKTPEVEIVDLHDVLAKEGADLAQDIRDKLGKDVDSFYQLNPFDRRDMLGRCIGEIARELENTTVMAVGSSQDFKAMVDLLRPYAETVIGGML